MLTILVCAFIVSFLATALVIRFRHLHERFTADSDLGGVQKFHASPVPRIGGVPVFLGLLAGVGIVNLKWPTFGAWLMLVAALPAWLAGLLEDMTKRVGPMPRLLATFVAAFLGFWLLKAGLHRLGIPGVDEVLRQYWILSLLFTVVAVGGVAHALNIIDGYNGLAGMVAILTFLVLGYVAYKVGDQVLWGICIAASGAVAGFLVLNFPRGLIFFGDGGAYMVGFLIAEISVLLVTRNPQVSPWFPMLLVIYPVFETLFSMYRKKFLRNMSPSMPDGLHLHMLVYKRLVRWMVGSKEARHITSRNSLTSPYLWVLSCVAVVPAAIFWDNTPVLAAFVVLFIALYLGVYRMIIRFKVPRWMVLRRRSRH